MMNIKVLVSSIIVGLGVSSAAMAATSATLPADGVTWQVNAIKDSKHALIVEPTGTVNLAFNPVDKVWTAGKAPFSLKVMGQADETMTLQAKLGGPVVLTNAADGKSMLNLAVTAGQTDLVPSVYNDILAANALNLGSALKGNTGAIEQASSNFTVKAKDGVDAAGKTADAGAVPDGNYSGQMVVDFQATWSGSASGGKPA